MRGTVAKDIKPGKEDLVLHSMTTVVNHPDSPRSKYAAAKKARLNGHAPRS